MLMKRVIPSLLYSDSGLYKTVKFGKKKYLGDVVNTVRLFNDLGADELIILDINATKNISARTTSNTGSNSFNNLIIVFFAVIARLVKPAEAI